VFFELTDLLTCPKCGPAHGLVLLVREVDDRRVLGGWLGCPNCREDYPVNAGVADLRLDAETDAEAPAHYQTDDLPVKIVALSGLAQERGYLLLDERLAHAAAAVAELAPQLEVIAVARLPDQSTESHGVSRVLSDMRFPLAEYRLNGVAISPGGDVELVAAAGRRLGSGARLVLFDATDEDLDEVRRAGLTVVAAESGTAVAERKSLPITGVGSGGQAGRCL